MNREQRIFCRLLDSLPLPLLSYDLQGHRVHSNERGQQLLREWRRQMQIQRALHELVRARASHWRGKSSVIEWQTQTVAFGSTSIVCQAAVVPLDLFGEPAFVLLILGQQGSTWSLDALQTAFRLTPKQARIASALAVGLSNQEIAEQLSISPHTVRRHTEQVFLKLNVRSRAQVADLLSRPPADS
jgi:DNA-binding NarL/FixJ family response regulator